MDRLVRWVHISDYLDIASSLRGGELLLTSGFRIGDDPAVQTRYVDELAAAGVAAIVLEAGKDFVHVPEPIIQASAKRELPLILLRTPAPYVDITERVHTALINSHYEALAEAQEVGEALTRLLLDGSKPRQIVQCLSGALRNPVFAEDAAHHLIECCPYGHGVDAIIAEWSGHSRGEHNRSLDDLASGRDQPRCAWADITVRNQNWGRVHVLEIDTPFDEMTRLVLERGTATLAMSLLAERGASNWVERAREALVDDIIHGSYLSNDDLLSRMRQLGVPLDGGQVIAAALEVYGDRSTRGSNVNRDVAALRACVRAALSATKGNGIHAVTSGRVLLLAAAPRTSNAGVTEFQNALTSGILDRASSALGEMPVLIGVSAVVNGVALRQALEQAELALKHRLMTEPETGVSDFSQLRFEQVFLELSEGPDLALLVERELGPLLSYDALNRAELAETLRVVLASPSVSVAAQTLHLERRSIYHRLEKVRSLIGCDLDDPATRTRLMIALEAHHYMPARGRRQ